MAKNNFLKKYFAGIALVLIISLAGIAFLSSSNNLPQSYIMVFKDSSGQMQSFIETSFPVNNQILLLPNTLGLNDFILQESVKNFEFNDKTDFNALLSKSIGKNVIVKLQQDSIEGTLVSANPLIVQTSAGLTNVNSYQSISIEGNQSFTSSPFLQFDSDYSKNSARVSFFSNNLAFSNKYVGILDGSNLTFSSQSSLTNNLGFDLKDAKLALTVGTLDKGQLLYAFKDSYGIASAGAPMALNPTQTTSQRIQGFKQITLSNLVNLQDGKTLFFSVIPQQSIQVQKESRLQYPGNPQVTITFNNSLGDLPQGTLDLYSPNEQGFLTFSSETQFSDQLNGSEISIQAGRNYFVTGDKKQSNYNFISKCIYESTQTWTLVNTAQNTENVSIIEQTLLNTVIVKEDASHSNEDATTFKWSLNLPKGNTVFSYTTRTTNC